VKVSSNVAIPLHGLDLSPFASESASLDDDGAMYDLYAVANHSGSVDSGHYTAHAKIQADCGPQSWYLFTDEQVHEVCSSPAVHEYSKSAFAQAAARSVSRSLHFQPSGTF
jgi:hypothetical protein